jgi:hypothetical protein
MIRAEFEVVVLVGDIPDQGLTKGQIGTIVDIYTTPSLSYEVEFCDKQGRTVALLALDPEQLDDYIP